MAALAECRVRITPSAWWNVAKALLFVAAPVLVRARLLTYEQSVSLFVRLWRRGHKLEIASRPFKPLPHDWPNGPPKDYRPEHPRMPDHRERRPW